MHLLLSLSSLFLLWFGSRLTLTNLSAIRAWSQRRALQLFVLALPLILPGLGLISLYHFFAHLCFADDAPWDLILDSLFSSMVALLVCGAACLALVRLSLMQRYIATYQRNPVPSDLQVMLRQLTQRRGTLSIQLLLVAHQAPIALTCGFSQPIILLSTWMLHHLDTHELEAVLAHEVEHVARRDYLLLFLATLLRDAFFYLPTTRICYRQLQEEKELVCDENVVVATRRPLALASALTKVWLYGVDKTAFPFSMGQSLVAPKGTIQERVERLIQQQELVRIETTHQKKNRSYTWNMYGLLALLLIQIGAFSIGMALIGCNPIILLTHLMH